MPCITLVEVERTVHVEPGQTVYFQYMIALSLIFEEADNQEQAARTVSKLDKDLQRPPGKFNSF